MKCFFNAENVIEKLVGNGEITYIDGNLDSARFNKPKSFAVDYKGNVYVADNRNHAVRMITKSGEICGGLKCTLWDSVTYKHKYTWVSIYKRNEFLVR